MNKGFSLYYTELNFYDPFTSSDEPIPEIDLMRMELGWITLSAVNHFCLERRKKLSPKNSQQAPRKTRRLKRQAQERPDQSIGILLDFDGVGGSTKRVTIFKEDLLGVGEV